MRGPKTDGRNWSTYVLAAVFVLLVAWVVVPRLLGTDGGSREDRLRATLQELRVAIALFRTHCGVNPREPSDLMATTAPAYLEDPARFRGPYLTTHNDELPMDPIDPGAKWRYDPETGEVRSSAAGKTIDGAPYSEL